MSDTQTKTKYETLLDAYNEATERLREINLLDIDGPESAEATKEVRDAQDALRQYMRTAVALRAEDER